MNESKNEKSKFPEHLRGPHDKMSRSRKLLEQIDDGDGFTYGDGDGEVLSEDIIQEAVGQAEKMKSNNNG